jgi:hypothetical protein
MSRDISTTAKARPRGITSGGRAPGPTVADAPPQGSTNAGERPRAQLQWCQPAFGLRLQPLGAVLESGQAPQGSNRDSTEDWMIPSEMVHTQECQTH